MILKEILICLPSAVVAYLAFSTACEAGMPWGAALLVGWGIAFLGGVLTGAIEHKLSGADRC